MCIKIKQIMLIFVILAFIVLGCDQNIKNTDIEMSDTFLNETRINYFKLNNYDNALNLTGSIKLTSGKIIIKIVSNDSDEIFIENDYIGNSNVNINISDLKNQKNINMVVIGENARNFSLSLNSLQKLTLNREPPQKPEK